MRKLLSIVLALAVVTAYAIDPPLHRYGLVPGNVQLKSAGALTFGPDGILFVADTQAASIYAFDLKDTDRDTASVSTEVKGIDKALGSFLAFPPRTWLSMT